MSLGNIYQHQPEQRGFFTAGELFPLYVPTPARGPIDPLRGEKNQPVVPRENLPRPPGDTRSAEQIINDNPILKWLDSKKDIRRDWVGKVNGKIVVRQPVRENNIYFEMAYKQLGDWTSSNPYPQSRADAAYNAARVLNWIDGSLSATGKIRSQDANNGVLEGFTRSGYAVAETPASMWQAFTEEGYGALSDKQWLTPREDGPPTVGPQPFWSDEYLLRHIAYHFREFAAGKNDRFVNINELKEAAGMVPSTRTFSAQAQESALELLARPELLLALDIGVGDDGPGKQDGRFDIENIAYVYKRSRAKT
ncbi:hypothetical protein [Pseudomonas salomonii]|uniref:hypothetical protein n=1 Tax=Pseudomonas salomonii TaxID=191391 RepID=UPI001F2B3A5E|nr:hypothetical protein [Pseudomonas salomonii]